MTLLLFILLILLAAVFTALKWRRTQRTLLALSAIWFLAVGCGPVPAWLLNNLQADYALKPTVQWGTHNAIVLLGAGTERVANRAEPGIFAYPRIVEAASMYNQCRQATSDCKVLVSGGDARRLGASEATVYRATLLALGVAQDDVLQEADSMNTWQNAEFTAELLKRRSVDRVVLVSSAIHLRRSELYFHHFGIEAIPQRADYLQAPFTAVPVSYSFIVADFAVHEYLGIARYYLYSALGWNPDSRDPGQA